MKISLEFDDSNFDKLIREFEKIEDVVKEGIEECAEKIVEDAKGFCPVDTGRLRDSIDYQMHYSNGWEAIIGTDVEYAYWVENGHATVGSKDGKSSFKSWVPGKPFLSTAYDMNKDFIQQYLMEKVSEALGGSSL